MDIEVQIDKNYTTPKLIVYTNEITEDLSNTIDTIANIHNKKLKASKDETLYILNQNEIETVYSENGKIYIRCNNQLYTTKHRLYELESLLDKNIFLRISNSEIVNFNLVKYIDLKITGTIVLNFKSGNISYSSRRYIPKIKDFLEVNVASPQ